VTPSAYDARIMETTFLTLTDIAHLAGVEVVTARTYHTRATANRRAGTPKPGDLPAPDQVFGQSPVWTRDTIDTWLKQRPGRGAGGGRPRKTDRPS